MKKVRNQSWTIYAEVALHICYWLFHFTSVNTNWGANWTDRSVRSGLAQTSVILHPVVFYLNAFWLIPRYLKANKWSQYVIISIGITLVLEIVRTSTFLIYGNLPGDLDVSFFKEFMSNDNLLFGLPNSLVFAFIFSTIYRFSRDWIVNQKVISEMQVEKLQLIKKLEELEKNVLNQRTKDSNELAEQLTSIVSHKNKVYKSTFQAKRRDEYFVLKAASITYLKAQGDFVLAYDSDGQSYILNYTLTVIEELLDPLSFFRINRGEIINSDYIIKYSNYVKNRLEIHLKGQQEALYTTNSRTPDFRKWIEEI